MKLNLIRAFRLAGVIILAAAMLCVMNGLALAKSLYAIAGINASPTPIRAYNINPDGTLTFQAEYGVPRYARRSRGSGSRHSIRSPIRHLRVFQHHPHSLTPKP